MSINNALEMYDWIDEMRLWWLNKTDVEQMKIGEEIDVLFLDRNFEEYGIWKNKEEKSQPQSPLNFFSSNLGKIRYLGDWRWLIITNAGKFEHPIHLCTKGLSTNWSWVGLDKDNYVPINSEMTLNDTPQPNRKKMKISIDDFHELNAVGWRGPIIKTKYLKKLPKVYYKD